jgi:hypothetical protein
MSNCEFQNRERHRPHRSVLVACLCLALGWSGVARAQSQPDRPADKRDTSVTEITPEEARLYGFLFPGGGQYYLGESLHGATVTARSIGLLGAGTLTLVINNCTFHIEDMGRCTPRRHFGQTAIGALLIAGGAWVWAHAAVEAGREAQRWKTVRADYPNVKQKASTPGSANCISNSRSVIGFC